MGALLKRLDDLRFDFDLSEDAFASGTLRDLVVAASECGSLCRGRVTVICPWIGGLRATRTKP